MKFIANIASKLKVTSLIVAALFSFVLFFSNVVPAMATPPKSNPNNDGTVQLDGILDKSEEILNKPLLSLEEVENRSKGGLNEVQGAADVNKMKMSNDTELPAVKQLKKSIDKIIK